MPKDDYNVLVYVILSYLYDCLKKGKEVDMELIDPEALDIPYSYWKMIFKNLDRQNLVEGIYVLTDKEGTSVQVEEDELEITPDGIEFLACNSTMRKVQDNLTKLAFPLLNLMAKMGLNI